MRAYDGPDKLAGCRCLTCEHRSQKTLYSASAGTLRHTADCCYCFCPTAAGCQPGNGRLASHTPDRTTNCQKYCTDRFASLGALFERPENAPKSCNADPKKIDDQHCY